MTKSAGRSGATFRFYLLAGAGLTAALALTSQAQAQTTPHAQDEEATEVDEIVVTGTRRSLEDALSTKRRSASIVDSIL